MNSILVLGLVLCAVIVPMINGDCVWREDRTDGVLCEWSQIDRSSIVELSDMATGATQLRIECDPNVLFESILADDLFAKLDTIERLHIDACKLLNLTARAFTTLSKLHTLTLNTKNSAWGQANKLQLEDGIFRGLNDLQVLNVAENNIRSLPENVFCPLRSMTNLNVSHNRIRSAMDLGFQSCGDDHLTQLKVIDLSYNELFTINSNWTRSDLRSVHAVLLHRNNLTKLEAGVFDGMTSLKVLNLSSNHLETIPSGLFARNTNLQELHLQDNKFYQLPADLFAQLSELLVLDLSGNQLSSHYVDTAIFSKLQRLVVLNLGNNALTRIDESTFAHLNFLQILDLKNNSIGFIDDQTFVPLTNLHTLNLGGNRLHIINNDLFNGLFVLSRLVLNNNLITVVESNAFSNCSSLRELDLSSNQLSDIPSSVSALSMLKSLDLGENRIGVMTNDSFRNLNQLTGLRLMDNLLTNITVGCLFDLPKLNVLNLARNKITTIERGAFDRNMEIEAIRLDRNLLNDVNGVFATLNSLLWLNLSENQLVWFDYAFIPMNLKWLDIHGNYIEALGNYYQLQSEISVTTLDASHNRITELGPASVPNSIELFFVNNNIIRNIYPNTFIEKTNLTRVDLYSNALTKLLLHSIRTAPMRMKNTPPEFYLGGNPFECDCSMGWLRQRSGDQISQHHPKIVDYETIECLVAHKRSNPVRLLSTLTHQDFLCRFESKCPATCHCCEFKSCHCQVKCPDMCSCFNDQSGNIMKINCGKQNAVMLPDRIPLDSSQVYLDGNSYLEMKSYSFASLKKVKSLFLNGSNIITIQNHALTGLSGLHKLHLNDNKLTVLYGYEFNQLFNLRELYLQDNMLSTIENETFAMLHYLQVLRLDGNRLARLSTWQMQSSNMRGLKSLTLGDNLWNCECKFLQEFIPFVYDNDVEVLDATVLQCVEGSGDARHDILANMTIESCGTSISNNVIGALPEGIPHGYIPLLGFALTIILVLAVLVAVFTVKEQICCAYPKSDSEKACPKPLYDALVLTAQADSDFVSQNIVADLKQTKPSTKFAMQHRNVPNGHIVPAANRSRKIIIYLTNAFLQTEWKRPEIRSAVSNSWIPGKIILIQTPNLQFASNTDRELINNIGRGIVLLKTWEIDFALKLSYSLDTHPSHYMESMAVPQPTTTEKIWKSTNSRLVHPYSYGLDYADADVRNDSYYSSATAESILSQSPNMPTKGSTTTVTSHVYAGIDSDYGSVTNEDSMVSVHRPLFSREPAESAIPIPNVENEATSMMESGDSQRNGFFV